MALSRYSWPPLALALALLSACSIPRPPVDRAPEPPATWYAPPLPHQGQAEDLGRWWARFNDPLLSDWIDRAQRLSPNVAAARAQVFSARAGLLDAREQGRPQLAAVASANRGFTDPTVPTGTTLSAGLQASWAIALWGEGDARNSAAQARQDAAGAGWHEARVLVAAELAQLYVGQRVCREQLRVAQADRESRRVTADSTAVTERAGLTAPAVAALARASAAESIGRYQQQAELCDRQVKALAALTGVAEPALRASLEKPYSWPARLDHLLTVPAVPADVLRQRPDVYRTQRDLVAAADGVGIARAALRPSLSFSGNVMATRFRGGGLSVDGTTWSIGPLTLSLPLLGRDRLNAHADAAVAQYEAAGSAYAATLRQAVSEVEQALVSLASLRERSTAAEVAVDGYRRSLAGTESRWRVGLASLNELEDARRVLLAAESGAVALRQERLQAWINLYVALGGGFEPAQATPDALKDAS